MEKEKRKPLCLIPARGGSKRFLRKNIALLGGKPLIAWTIKTAIDTGLFDHVWVTSEDKQILEIAEKWGSTTIQRSEDLAGDQVALEPVCHEALSVITQKHSGYSDLFLMLPTSPFRKKENILKAWKEYVANDADSLMSIVQYDSPPQWSMFMEDGKWLEPYDWEGFYSERQQILPLYHHDGAYFITNIGKFNETGLLMGPKTMPFTVSQIESVDIDEPIDLAWAEFLLEQGKAEEN